MNTERDPMDLCGEWIGHYKGHYDEVIRIERIGDEYVATKVTGDEYVPAGELTWRANHLSGIGQGQVAEKEFRNPRWIPGRLERLGPERIAFTWENCGKVEYRKDD